MNYYIIRAFPGFKSYSHRLMINIGDVLFFCICVLMQICHLMMYVCHEGGLLSELCVIYEHKLFFYSSHFRCSAAECC